MTEISTSDHQSGRLGRRYSFSEDIWAVLIASVLIVGALAWAWATPGVKLPAPTYQWAGSADFYQKVLHPNNLGLLAGIALLFGALSALVAYTSGSRWVASLGGFAVLFTLALTALIIAGNAGVASYGVEYVVFALIAGLLLGNIGRTPAWLLSAARSEFYIKTGLIVLGTSILFADILQAGLPGILQAVAVVSVVWVFSLYLSRRLKVDDEFGVMIASAVSICGVSAAIVAAGAIQGDKKKLSYVTSLVLLVAIPMLVLQPWLIKAWQIPEVVGGAWLGGTLDTTASVTAAAQLVGPVATKAGVIVKFSQNVLIGVAAFFITSWWVLRHQNTDAGAGKSGISVVWERFPKFVLGFLAASVLCSFLIPADTVKQAAGLLNGLRTIWFSLAFVAIGLEARLTDLLRMQGGRPALSFVGAQAFNLLWTLLWSYLLFGGVLLSPPTL